MILPALFFSCAGGPQAAPESYAASDAGPLRRESARMIAYTVSITITVKNIDAAFETLPGKIEAQGGFILQESSPSISTRIPAENVEAFIGQLENLGEITALRKSGVDITDQYRDDLIRLESLKTVRERYLDLLDQAATVTEILAIEKELERINTEIEVLEGQKKYAEQRVDYTHVSVYVQEKARPGPPG